jgi:hypothetical protein
MNLPTYKSTPFLDDYPDGEKFKTYQGVHRRLMAEDVSYRHEQVGHWMGMVFIGLFPTVVIPTQKWGVEYSIAGTVLSAILIVYLAIRRQKKMNFRIGQELGRKAKGNVR